MPSDAIEATTKRETLSSRDLLPMWVSLYLVSFGVAGTTIRMFFYGEFSTIFILLTVIPMAFAMGFIFGCDAVWRRATRTTEGEGKTP